MVRRQATVLYFTHTTLPYSDVVGGAFMVLPELGPRPMPHFDITHLGNELSPQAPSAERRSFPV